MVVWGGPICGSILYQARAFDAVAAAETVDGELAVAAVDLQGEEVFPFGAARMEPGDLAGRRLQQGKAVVLDGPVPEIPADMAGHFREIAEKGAARSMRWTPWSEHFAAAGEGGVAAPFLFHAEPAAMAVPAADEHERAEGTAGDDLSGCKQGGVEAVVEADFDDDAAGVEGFAGRRRDRFQLAGIAGGGLFNQARACRPRPPPA